MNRILLCAVLAASAPSFAQTTVPATPTLHANAAFKGLQFDWAPAARASWYQLEYRAHQTGDFVQVGDDFPASANSTGFSFPLHLYDWTYARYRLAACNSAGCSRSAEVSVSSLRLDAVGYFKASQPQQYADFGSQLDISPDGYNFVSAAIGDPNDVDNGGIAYVFRRGSNGVWTERARLTSTNPPYLDEHNIPLSADVTVNATGNTVAIGIPDYLHQPSDSNMGEVQVFQWNGASWVRTRVPRVASWQFGTKVQLSDAGTTLAVGLVTQQQEPEAAIYKLTNGAWQNVRTITPKAGSGESCAMSGFSRDGSTLAQVCSVPQGSNRFGRFYIRVWSGSNWTVSTDIPLQLSVSSSMGYVSGGFAISAKGDTIAAQISIPSPQVRGDSQVQVFKRGTNGLYSKVTELIAGPWSHGYGYGWTIAISGDGATMSVGDFTDDGKGTGPRAAPLFAGANMEGGVYVYRLSGTWKLANMVKPNYLTRSDREEFGRVLALSGSGKTLLIGDPEDTRGSDGIGSDWRTTVGGGAPTGSVWMY
jgi:hypothetical protein